MRVLKLLSYSNKHRIVYTIGTVILDNKIRIRQQNNNNYGCNDNWANAYYYGNDYSHCITELQKLGVEADIIIFRPYGRWGFSMMDMESDMRSSAG